MNKYLSLADLEKKFSRWGETHYIQLAVFNVIILLLVLLRSAQYFEPFFPLSINLIVFISLLLSIFLLGTRSWFFFILALVFWSLTALLKAVLKIDVWAERAAIYSFESLVFGNILLVVENIDFKKILIVKSVVVDGLLKIRELFLFLWKRRLWWLVLMIVIFVVGILVFLIKSSLVPIIYPLF